ncbi:MAG: FimV-like protein, partial [Arenicella sp.]
SSKKAEGSSKKAEGSTKVEEDSGIDIDGDFSDDTALLDGDEPSLTKRFDDSNAVEFELTTSAFDDKSKNDSDAESDHRIPHDLSDLEIDDDYDEAQTQYELAKVFMDLGDEDGARKILGELVATDEISQDLMSAARKLLKSLQR